MMKQNQKLLIASMVILVSICLLAILLKAVVLNKVLKPLMSEEEEHFQSITPASYNATPTRKDNIDSNTSCSISSGDKAGICGENKNLLPVHETTFNIREIIKQMLLLEDHLFQTEKQCIECINKHFLTIEALAEEGISLDTTNKFQEMLHQVVITIRSQQKSFSNKTCNRNEMAKKVRDLRKYLMKYL